MDFLTAQLLQYLAEYGPWFLFAMAILETCFVTGLVVPSGLATSVGTVLALEGAFALPSVLLAALAGGWVGDHLGYWIGRAARERVQSGEGRLARWVGTRPEEAGRFFGRHPIYSVTAARVVSFVRTLMPMTAGISRIPYATYVPYELAGLVAWVALYVGIGVVAEESWDQATRLVGIGGTLAFVVVGGFLWVAFRRRQRKRRAARPREDQA